MKRIIIEYLPNYKVRYSFSKADITEDEGNGWYSVIGSKIVCNSTLLKEFSSTKGLCNISELSEDLMGLLNAERDRYESSIIHKNRLCSFTQLLINYGNKTM